MHTRHRVVVTNKTATRALLFYVARQRSAPIATATQTTSLLAASLEGPEALPTGLVVALAGATVVGVTTVDALVPALLLVLVVVELAVSVALVESFLSEVTLGPVVVLAPSEVEFFVLALVSLLPLLVSLSLAHLSPRHLPGVLLFGFTSLIAGPCDIVTVALALLLSVRSPSVFVVRKVVSPSALLLQTRKSRVHTTSTIAAEVMVGPWGFVSGPVHLCPRRHRSWSR